MKKVIIKILVLVVVFTASVYFINKAQSKRYTDLTAEMDAATLPLVYGELDGIKVNCLHGYREESIDDTLLRDTIYPMDGDRHISLTIDERDCELDKLDYEVRSGDSSSLVEQGKVKNVNDGKENTKEVSFSIRMDLKAGQEYILKLYYHSKDDRVIYFFTRIKYDEGMHAVKHISFVKDFNDTIFDKDKAQELQQYLETNPEKANNNLGNVDITSSLEAVTFADLSPDRVTKPVPMITEINNEIASVEMDYYISVTNSNEIKEYYAVKEYYRVRYSPSRMYLLGYERHQEELYQPELIDKSTNALKMGITESSNVQSITSDECKKAAFVRENQLWYYDYQNVEVTRVFSFLREDYTDARYTFDQHGIKVIQMDDKGNLTFAVYGYMNRGKHEGQCGIAVYQYLSGKDTIEEKIFIPSEFPYQTLKTEVDKLCFLNKEGALYLLYDGNLLCISIQERTVSNVVSDMTDDSIVVSANQHLVAIQDTVDPGTCKRIQIIDLNTGKQRFVAAPENETLQAIGFVDEDFVYGKCKGSGKNEAEQEVFPLYEVVIEDENGQEVRNYNQSDKGLYVMNAEINNNMVQLDLYHYEGGIYQQKDADYIVNKGDSQDNEISYEYTYTGSRYNELYMKFPAHIYISQAPSQLNTKEVVTDDYRVIEVGGDDNQYVRYFVYAKGNMSGSYSSVAKAVIDADENAGVVLNSKQKYIWEDGQTAEYGVLKNEVNMIKATDEKDSLAAGIAMMINYGGKEVMLSDVQNLNESPETTMSRYLKNAGLNLTGCTLDEVLYYVGHDCPVLAKDAQGDYLVIVSYNQTAIRYLKPSTGEEVRSDIEPMRKQFEESGNVFYSYAK